MSRTKTKYNNVSVITKNLGTHNHCINTNQLINNKDFNFIIENKSYILSPTQVMNYIAQHPKCHVFIQNELYDEDTGYIKHYTSNFYLISDDYIINQAS